MIDDSNDLVGLEIRTSQEERIGFWRAAALGSTLLLTLCVVGIWLLAMRPPIVRYVRIDGIKGAVPIRYNDLDYTPALGEIGKTLLEWTQYRERRLRGVIQKDFPNNYYFVDRKLSSIAMQADLRDQTVAMIQTGRKPESTIEDAAYEFSDFQTRKTADGTLAKGAATIRFTKVLNPGLAMQTKEQRSYTVQFYVNPTQVADLAEKDPMFAQINPLGLTVTSWFEARSK